MVLRAKREDGLFGLLRAKKKAACVWLAHLSHQGLGEVSVDWTKRTRKGAGGLVNPTPLKIATNRREIASPPKAAVAWFNRDHFGASA
jgi:hypothetical protein